MVNFANINPISISTVYIEILYEDVILGCGTAFYVRNKGALYLVSNWHNYSGRHPETNAVIHRDAAIPDKIKTYGYRKKVDQGHYELEELTHHLYDNDYNAKWFQHAEQGSQIDVAALPVEIEDDNEIVDIYSAIDEIDPYDNSEIQIGEDLFVIGYPFGITVEGYTPIWKSASIASEPILDIDNLPLFYIDTATRQGMSGSPVVLYKRRSIGIGDARNVYRFHADVIGVYSGRIIPKDLIEVQLGRVWKEPCIEKVLNGNLYPNN